VGQGREGGRKQKEEDRWLTGVGRNQVGKKGPQKGFQTSKKWGENGRAVRKEGGSEGGREGGTS